MKPEVLHKLHEIEIEMLDEIDRICKKHHITYFLSGGTLLGAVRHNGFIPWDDDIDVVMPRKEYERFLEICKSELSDMYYVSCTQTKNYILPIAKIHQKNTLFLGKRYFKTKYTCYKWGIFVDIFPLDNAKNNKFTRMQYLIANKLNYYLTYKFGFDENISVKFKIISTLLSIFSVEFIKKCRDYICKLQNNNDHCTHLTRMGTYYKMETVFWSKEKLFPLSKIEFEGKMYPAPHDPHYFLQKKYGIDYMELPPIEKRRTHGPVKISFNIAEGFVDL